MTRAARGALVVGGLVVGLGLIAWLVSGGDAETVSDAVPSHALHELAWPEEGPERLLDAALEPSGPPLEEVAQQLAGAEGVVCTVEPSVDGGTARLTLDADIAGDWLAVAAARAHVLVLSEIPAEGSGTLRVEGFAPEPIRWQAARDGAGSCTPDPLVLRPAEAGVVGTVGGADGPSGSFGLTACGQAATVDAEGGFFAAAVPGEPCEVVLRRHYGVWEFVERVEVVPRMGRDEVLELELPPFEAVLPLVVEDGRVGAVWDEGQDWAGAVVHTVDGEAVPADADGFHLATGGRAGTVAEVELELDGERQLVEVPRKALTFEDWLVR
ncbi:MAG: hypothetical protein KTR31_28210 [Myxococcales bacterium]|nr:hypothetical protein [Myxococcales bacterium]